LNEEKNKYRIPDKLEFSLIDYFKYLYEWIRAFKTTFKIKPGLYFTGNKYDINTPLLVTCNYHMTVFILWRMLRNRNVRILVINTVGINVWCSAGKGRFSAGNIKKHIRMYDPESISASERVEVILPKLSLSGVSLARLKQNKIIPRIGPVYVADLPEYLDNKPYQDRIEDTFKFHMKDRIFSLVPSIVQFTKYLLYMFIGLFIWDYFFSTGIHWQVFVLGLSFGILYIILFPWLPTKKFAIKSLFLSLLYIVGFISMALNNQELVSSTETLIFYITFTVATAIFFALYFTGSSGASNYSLVKKEIITFLPVSVLFYLIAFFAIIYEGIFL